jgi:hypothetical protein
LPGGLNPWNRDNHYDDEDDDDDDDDDEKLLLYQVKVSPSA